jgi:FAD dependent oxidoreductase TIGR03364
VSRRQSLVGGLETAAVVGDHVGHMATRVVVVGGGILGTMQAWFARQHGADVIQVERDVAPRRASVRNFGLVWVSGRAPGIELSAALRARQLWEQVGAAVPEAGFRPAGSLTVALDPSEVKVLEEVCARVDAAERGLTMLTAAEARGRNPALGGTFEAALFCERDGVVEPGRVLGAMRARLEADGGYRFLGGRNVVAVEDRCAIDQHGGRHEGDVVIACTGDQHAGIGAIALVEAPVRRVRLQMMQTAPTEIELTTAVADGDSLRYYPAFQVPSLAALPPQHDIAAAHHLQLLMVQRLDGGLTIGDTHAYDEPFDFAVEEVPYQLLRERAETILGRPLPPIVRRWAGVYSQVTEPDQMCFRAVIADGVVLVTGPGGRGMTLSPAIAEATLAELGW